MFLIFASARPRPGSRAEAHARRGQAQHAQETQCLRL